MNRILDLFKKKEQPIEERSFAPRFFSGGIITGNRKGNVSEKELLSLPSALKCLELISNQIASFDIQLIKETKATGKTILEDYRMELFNNQNNSFEDASTWKKEIVKDYLLHGSSYTYVERKGNKIESLHQVKFLNEELITNDKGIVIHKNITCILNGKTFTDSYNNFLIIKNPNGGILHNAQVVRHLVDERDNLHMALSESCSISHVLQTEGRMNEKTILGLRGSFDKLYTSPKQNGGQRKPVAVLEEGLTLKKIENDNPIFGQLKEWEQKELRQISLLFNLPSVQFLNGVNQSHSSMQESLYNQTIQPLLTVIEKAIENQLLLTREKDIEVVFDVSTMNRMDEEKRINMMKELFKKGCISNHAMEDALNIPRSEKAFYNFGLGDSLLFDEEIDKEDIQSRLVVFNTISSEIVNEKNVKVEEEIIIEDKMKEIT